jgi:hypothetical protein
MTTPYRENALALPERPPLWRLALAWITRPWRRLRAMLEASEQEERRAAAERVHALATEAVARAERDIKRRLLPPPMPAIPPIPPMVGLEIRRTVHKISRPSRASREFREWEVEEARGRYEARARKAASDRLLAVAAGTGVVAMIATAVLISTTKKTLVPAPPPPPTPDPSPADPDGPVQPPGPA